MRRYVQKPERPAAGWPSHYDGWLDLERVPPLVVIEDERKPVYSGLLSAQGTPLYRVPEEKVVGFRGPPATLPCPQHSKQEGHHMNTAHTTGGAIPQPGTEAHVSFTDSPPTASPGGDYAIVELFGHVTLVGRIEEVEAFGAKMLSIEPMFNGVVLPRVMHGGGSIYRVTPCSEQIAREHQPKHGYQLPPAIRAIVPATMLNAPSTDDGNAYDDEIEF